MPDPALLSIGCGVVFAAATGAYVELRARFLALGAQMDRPAIASHALPLELREKSA